MNIKANYKVIPLVGTMDLNDLGDGVTGSSVHQVYCLSDGSIDITALGGGTFTWSGTTNSSIDVVVKSINVNSGTFIGFKSKSNIY